MKTTKTITTAKDILALVNFICSHKAGLEYKLCDVVKIVGNYLYYRTHKDKYPTYRVDLLNISNGAIKIKE